eukprot:s683_g13.t1
MVACRCSAGRVNWGQDGPDNMTLKEPLRWILAPAVSAQQCLESREVSQANCYCTALEVSTCGTKSVSLPADSTVLPVGRKLAMTVSAM